MTNVFHILMMTTAIFACIAPVICIHRAMKERQSKALIYFILVILSALLTSLGALLVLMSSETSAMINAVKIVYTGRIFCATMIPLFLIEYNQYCISRLGKLLTSSMFLLSVGMLFDGEERQWFFTHVHMETVNYITLFRCDYGVLYVAFLVEVLFIYLGMIVVLTRKIITTKKGYRGRHIMLLTGIMTTGVGIILTDTTITCGVDIIPFCMAISCILFTINLSKYHMFDMTQNAKEMVVGTLEEGVVVLDDSEKILYTNEIINQYLIDKDMNLEQLRQVLKNVCEGNEITLFERTFQVHISLVKRENGTLQGYLYELHDTTKTKERMLEMERLMNEAKTANNAKGQFLANMSHEIRTPINAILGMNEMILRENQEDSITEYASNISVAGRALLSLINDILDYSKLETNVIEWVNIVYKVNDLMQELELKIFPEIEKKPVTFEIHVDDDVPSELFGDENRVKQVVMNILKNAVKYTDEGTVKLHVFSRDMDHEIAPFPGATVDYEVKYIVFQVTDTGQGIKQENLEGIFESFKRIEEGKNRNIEGAGLGLTLTKKILDYMDGKIEATSEYGKGSVFTLYIPQAISDVTPQKSLNLTYHSKNKTISQRKFTITKGTVLVVDDNAVNLKVASSLLKRTKATVLTAMSGKECLELVQKEKIDIIFMDHLMSEMDGVETFNKWRLEENRISKDIPVIALTANLNSGSREQYLAYGFTDYLSKPIDARELENTLLKYLPMELIEMEEE